MKLLKQEDGYSVQYSPVTVVMLLLYKYHTVV